MAHLPIRREWPFLARGFEPVGVGQLIRWVRASLPVACLLCEQRAPGNGLCVHCHGRVTSSMRNGTVVRCPRCCLALSATADCADCKERAPAFDRVLAGFDYAHPGDLLIQALKVQQRFTHAAALSSILAQSVRLACDNVPGALPRPLLVVPVPSGEAALRHRGFNPAGEIARGLAPYLRAPVRVDMVRRGGSAGQQKQRSRRERAQQAATLYDCVRRCDGYHIALVDDVMTTGATLHNIALALRRAGALSVIGLVAARTPLH